MSITATRLCPEPPTIVRLLTDRAELLSHRGRIAESHALFASAITADPTPSARIAFAVLLAQTNPQQAIDELEAAWNESLRLGSQVFRSVCCQNLSLLFRRIGNDVRAMQYQQLAIAAEMDSDEFADSATFSPALLIDIAATWSVAEEPGVIDVLLATAESQVEDDNDQRATIASHRGVTAARSLQTSQALRHLLRAYRLYRECGNEAGCAHCLVNLGHVLQERRRYAESGRCFRLAAELFDQLGQSEQSSRAIDFGREVASRLALDTVNPLWN